MQGADRAGFRVVPSWHVMSTPSRAYLAFRKEMRQVLVDEPILPWKLVEIVNDYVFTGIPEHGQPCPTHILIVSWC